MTQQERLVYAVAFGPDEHTVVAGKRSGWVDQVDLRTRQPIGTTHRAVGGVDTLVAIGDRADRVVIGAHYDADLAGEQDKWFNVRSIDSWRLVGTLDGERGGNELVVASHDGRIVATATNHSAIVWAGDLLSEVHTIETGVQIASLALSGDGALIAVVDVNGRIAVCESDSGNIRLETTSQREGLTSALSADGSMLALGDRSGSIEVWDVATGRRLASSSRHTVPVSALAFSPDGRFLVSTSGDRLVSISVGGEILVWETVTWTVAAAPQVPIQPYYCVAFNRSGTAFVVGGAEDLVQSFDVASAVNAPNDP